MKIYHSADEGLAPHQVKLSLYRSDSRRALVEPMHGHDFLEISYVMDGEANQILNGIPHTVKKGDVLLLRPGETHSITMDNGFQLLDCLIGEKVATELDRQMAETFHASLSFLPTLIRPTGQELLEIRRIFDAILKEYDPWEESSQLMTRCLLNMLLVRLFRHIQNADSHRTDDISVQILVYIEENLDTICLSTIAQHFGYSTSYFSRYFKELFGVGLTAYVNSLKIHRVERLIRESRRPLTVEEICDRAGFKDRKHFCALFKEYTGVTPSKALAQLQQGRKKK